MAGINLRLAQTRHIYFERSILRWFLYIFSQDKLITEEILICSHPKRIKDYSHKLPHVSGAPGCVMICYDEHL